MTLTRDQKALINTAFEFANLEEIKSTTQVESIFLKWKYKFQRENTWKSISPGRIQYQALSSEISSFEDAEASGISAYAQDQADLIGTINGILKGNLPTEESINALIQGKVSAEALFIEGKIRYHYEITGVEAFYGYATALILDQGLTKHLRQCPVCGKYFMIYDKQKLKQKYCSSKCKLTGTNQKTKNRANLHNAKKKTLEA